MRTRKLFFTVILLLLPGNPGAFAAPPRLAIVIVVDQMRADYLDRYADKFTGGFARLVKEGAVFTHARHGHVPTETGPGHAAILTGCFPSRHGIVSNDWWDRASGKMTYCVEDPDYERSPKNFLCPTVGDALKAARPESKVVSLAGKDRVAILLGGHKPDLALWYHRGAGQFVTSPYYGRMPDWAWRWDATLRIPQAEREPIIETSRFDLMLLELARLAVSEQDLGGGQRTDLLAVGLSATDYMGHKYGPFTPEHAAQLLSLDRALGEFLGFLDKRLGRGNYIVVLTADHGVTPKPESPGEKARGARRVDVNDFKQKLESELRKSLGPPPASKGNWVYEIYPPHVYLSSPIARGPAARILEESPEIAHVFRPEDFSADVSSAPYFEVFRRSYRKDRSGDLMILIKEHVLLSDYVTEAGHGLPYDSDARVPIIFSGPGIRPGRYDREILATDIAPTLAKLLEVGFATGPGSNVLEEALQAAPAPLAH